MEGYTNVFKNSFLNFNEYIKNNDLLALLQNFRICRQIYGFIDNGDNEPDKEAIEIAQKINSNLYNTYYENCYNKKILGYGNYTPVNGKFNNLDSRHIMMSIILFENIKEDINDILEIGGGFGGWLRLNNNIQNFNKWHIVDLPHLNILQEWYLTENNIPLTKYKLYKNTDYNELLDINYELVIGAHSLSEFSIEIFTEYYNKLIKKAKYLFYAYHKYLPSIELINTKLNIINNDFILITNVNSENDKVNNCLYINKSFMK
jgi:hypothetical protein